MYKCIWETPEPFLKSLGTPSGSKVCSSPSQSWGQVGHAANSLCLTRHSQKLYGYFGQAAWKCVDIDAHKRVTLSCQSSHQPASGSLSPSPLARPSAPSRRAQSLQHDDDDLALVKLEVIFFYLGSISGHSTALISVRLSANTQGLSARQNDVSSW